MCLEVPENTRVRIAFEADHGELAIVWREPWTPEPSSREAGWDKYVDAGQTLEAHIVGCLFRMLLRSPEPGFSSTPYTIRIEEIDD